MQRVYGCIIKKSAMRIFPCPYLNGEVELTDEREEHIALTQPDLLPEYLPQVKQTLADPDQVRRIITAYITRRLIHGEIEWQKS